MSADQGAAKKYRVLVTGASGYLGQVMVRSGRRVFLVAGRRVGPLPAALTPAGCAHPPSKTQVQHLQRGDHDVHCTYTSGEQDWCVFGATSHRVDFATGAGLDACLVACCPLDAVINCAAISQPASCAKAPELARAVNVPTALLASLAVASPQAFFIHLSTDHVYEGNRPWWKEDDAPHCKAVNAYGASKRDAEAAVAAAWRHHAILRSSAIIGPVRMPFKPVSRSVFTQWLDSSLAAGPVQLFEDEYRSPVFILDICAAVDALLRICVPHPGSGREPCDIEHRVFNLGGPERCVCFGDWSGSSRVTRRWGITHARVASHSSSASMPSRLSRADMGDALAAVRGYPPDRVVRVPCSSVVRDPPSPQDISMDVARVQKVLGIRLTPFAEALHQIFVGGGAPAQK